MLNNENDPPDVFRLTIGDWRDEGCTFLQGAVHFHLMAKKSVKHHLVRVNFSRRVRKSHLEVVKVTLEHRKVLLKFNRSHEIVAVVDNFHSESRCLQNKFSPLRYPILIMTLSWDVPFEVSVCLVNHPDDFSSIFRCSKLIFATS